MKLDRFKTFKIIAALGLGGTLFAGYLTFFKAITGTCALGESCPYVLGLPACVYGFVMFLTMTIVAGYGGFRRILADWPEKTVQIVAIVGTLFAGWLTYEDVGPWLQSGGSYDLYLPSCVYGLVFYIAILVLSSMLVTKSKKPAEVEVPEQTEEMKEDTAAQKPEEAAVPQEENPEVELPEMLRKMPSEQPKTDDTEKEEKM